jgi:hypothetical protein
MTIEEIQGLAPGTVITHGQRRYTVQNIDSQQNIIQLEAQATTSVDIPEVTIPSGVLYPFVPEGTVVAASSEVPITKTIVACKLQELVDAQLA